MGFKICFIYLDRKKMNKKTFYTIPAHKHGKYTHKEGEKPIPWNSGMGFHLS